MIPSPLNVVVIDNIDLHIFQFNIGFVIYGSILRFKLSKQPYHWFEYQWLDNVKINKYTEFNPNIPCGLRVMIIFTD